MCDLRKIHFWTLLFFRLSKSIQLFGNGPNFFLFFWPKLLRTANYKKYYFLQDGATSHTAKRVQEWQDGGQILEQENVASTITGIEPCRLLSMGLSLDSGVQPYAENIGRIYGKHQERNK